MSAFRVTPSPQTFVEGLKEGMAAMDGQVAVTAGVTRVPCRRGGELLVRPVRRRVNIDAKALAHKKGGPDDVVNTEYVYTVFRAAVVGAEGVTDLDGQSVPFTTERHPQLGPLCHPDVLEAVDEVDVLEVYKLATTHLQVAARGN